MKKRIQKKKRVSKQVTKPKKCQKSLLEHYITETMDYLYYDVRVKTDNPNKHYKRKPLESAVKCYLKRFSRKQSYAATSPLADSPWRWQQYTCVEQSKYNVRPNKFLNVGNYALIPRPDPVVLSFQAPMSPREMAVDGVIHRVQLLGDNAHETHHLLDINQQRWCKYTKAEHYTNTPGLKGYTFVGQKRMRDDIRVVFHKSDNTFYEDANGVARPHEWPHIIYQADEVHKHRELGYKEASGIKYSGCNLYLKYKKAQGYLVNLVFQDGITKGESACQVVWDYSNYHSTPHIRTAQAHFPLHRSSKLRKVSN